MPDSAGSGTVVITARSFSTGSLDLDGRLTRAGLEVVRAATDHGAEAMREPLAHAVAWIAGTSPVTGRHLAMARNLRIVARYGVGVDAVDLAAARTAGVAVTNTPGANSDAVAEHTCALLLAVLRGVSEGDARVRRDDWRVIRGRQLQGSTVGVMGFGRIGRATAWRLHALGCRVIVHDPRVADEVIAAAGFTPVQPGALCRHADLVCLHATGGKVLVDSEWVRRASPGQVIVNTGRADLVDEAAIARGLRSGALSGYAADMLADEPDARGSLLLDPALEGRVVVTPHLGAQTPQAVDRMGAMAVDAVLRVLDGQRPENALVWPGEGTDG